MAVSFDAVEFPDGSFYTLYTNSAGDGFLVNKFNSNGLRAWSKKFVMNQNFAPWGIALCNYNNSLVIATEPVSIGTRRAAGLVRIDSSGNFLWGKYYFKEFEFRLSNVISTSDNNLLVEGMYKNGPQRTEFAMKVDGNGDFIWGTSFGQPYGWLEYLAETPDHNYILAGPDYFYDPQSFFNDYLIVLDSSGALIQARSYDISGKSGISDLAIEPDGNLLLMMSKDANGYANIIRTNAQYDAVCVITYFLLYKRHPLRLIQLFQ
ncbi:MAG: hypothetical protein IPO63_04450 [Bacteroidetes bacterium]|nr:hypothetical protein [Bacteroidota bacterium]